MTPTPPTIADAKQIATDRRQLGVLILAFDGSGSFSIATFGQNRRLCDAMRKVNDQLADSLAAGEIAVPDELRGTAR